MHGDSMTVGGLCLGRQPLVSGAHILMFQSSEPQQASASALGRPCCPGVITIRSDQIKSCVPGRIAVVACVIPADEWCLDADTPVAVHCCCLGLMAVVLQGTP